MAKVIGNYDRKATEWNQKGTDYQYEKEGQRSLIKIIFSCIAEGLELCEAYFRGNLEKTSLYPFNK